MGTPLPSNDAHHCPTDRSTLAILTYTIDDWVHPAILDVILDPTNSGMDMFVLGIVFCHAVPRVLLCVTKRAI